MTIAIALIAGAVLGVTILTAAIVVLVKEAVMRGLNL
jgi:hypothetical protein